MSSLYAKLHNGHGEIVEVDSLTPDGRQDGIYQCERLIEELKDAAEDDD